MITPGQLRHIMTVHDGERGPSKECRLDPQWPAGGPMVLRPTARFATFSGVVSQNTGAPCTPGVMALPSPSQPIFQRGASICEGVGRNLMLLALSLVQCLCISDESDMAYRNFTPVPSSRSLQC